MPRVSVCLACYNGEASLAEALGSIRAQTFTDYEIVFVDDGSTDKSAIIANSFGCRVIQQQNTGLGGARKRLVEEASGELIAFLDHDDIWLPSKLKMQVPFHDRPEVVLSHTAAFYEHDDGRRWTRTENLPDGTSSFDHVLPLRIIAPTAIFSREAMLRAGNFAADVRICSDWYGWMILARFGSFAYLPEPLMRYRVRAGANSAPGLRFFEAERYLIEQKLVPRFDELTQGVTQSNRKRYRSILVRHLGSSKRAIAHYARLNGDRGLALRMHREAVACEPTNIRYWLSWIKNAVMWRTG